MGVGNRLAEAPATDPEDRVLVLRAKSGDRDALEELVGRHQAWIYNIALRMLYHPQDAEDATQEILVKAVTALSSFEGRSSFRTWLYRIAVNHILNTKRGRLEPARMSFSCYAHALDRTPDLDLPDQRSVPVDLRLLVDEARLSCTSGMLLCLDREQRLIYILGEILEVTDAVGAELLEISRENFRQRLARARRDLHSFMRRLLAGPDFRRVTEDLSLNVDRFEKPLGRSESHSANTAFRRRTNTRAKSASLLGTTAPHPSRQQDRRRRSWAKF